METEGEAIRVIFSAFPFTSFPSCRPTPSPLSACTPSPRRLSSRLFPGCFLLSSALTNQNRCCCCCCFAASGNAVSPSFRHSLFLSLRCPSRVLGDKAQSVGLKWPDLMVWLLPAYSCAQALRIFVLELVLSTIRETVCFYSPAVFYSTSVLCFPLVCISLPCVPPHGAPPEHSEHFTGCWRGRQVQCVPQCR